MTIFSSHGEQGEPVTGIPLVPLNGLCVGRMKQLEKLL